MIMPSMCGKIQKKKHKTTNDKWKLAIEKILPLFVKNFTGTFLEIDFAELCIPCP